jgi:hypothetical protein
LNLTGNGGGEAVVIPKIERVGEGEGGEETVDEYASK